MKTKTVENILKELEGISCAKSKNILIRCIKEVEAKAIYKPKPPSIIEMLFGIINRLKTQTNDKRNPRFMRSGANTK